MKWDALHADERDGEVERWMKGWSGIEVEMWKAGDVWDDWGIEVLRGMKRAEMGGEGGWERNNEGIKEKKGGGI